MDLLTCLVGTIADKGVNQLSRAQEASLGAGLARAFANELCRREEAWVTSELWNNYHDPRHVRLACERSLRDLRLDYLHFYLVHFPIALEFVPFDRRYPPGWFHAPEADLPLLGQRNVHVAL